MYKCLVLLPLLWLALLLFCQGLHALEFLANHIHEFVHNFS